MQLFLTSSVHMTAQSIFQKVSNQVRQSGVFITTPILDKPEQDLSWHHRNIKSMQEAGFVFDFYDIADKSSEQLRVDIGKYSWIYIEGGNPFYLLQESQKNGFDTYIRERVAGGMLYISTSAGSVIAGPDIASGSRPGKSASELGLADTTGYGLVNFVVMPHWGKDAKQAAYMEHKIPTSYKEDYPYILLNDNQYIEIIDDWMNIVDITKKP